MSDEHLKPRLELDLDEVEGAFHNMERRARALAPAFRALRRPMISDQKQHAREAKGPEGAWPPRAAATEERRRARNRRTKQTRAMRTISPRPSKRKSTPKQLLGRLPMIFKMVTSALSIRMVSRAPWSGAHMHGAKVGHGRKVTLPRRWYYYLSDALVGKAREIFAEHIIKDWGRP